MSDIVVENGSKEKVFYTIEAPGVLRSNASYNVVVSIFEANEPCEIEIKIFGGNYSIEKTVLVLPFTSETLSFEIPDLCSKEEYYLEAKGHKGIEFKENINLRFKEGKPLTYIQCDKQAYKRGDNVDYRICVLDPNMMKPAVIDKPISVKIKLLDSLLKEDTNIQLDRGIFNSKWLIPTDARHGTYDIEVYTGDMLVALKSFEIIDYMPPKFNIKINTADELLYDDKQLHIQVDASYPDGTPITGVCKLEIASVAGYFSRVYIERTQRIINGSTELNIIDLIEDLHIRNSFKEMDWFSTATIMVKATITADNDEANAEETLTTLVTVKKNNEAVDELSGSCCNVRDWYDIDSEDKTEKEVAPVKIKVAQKRTNIGDTLDFSIILTKPTKFCIYFVVARGNIIKSELVNVENHNQPIERSLEMNFEYVPRAFILAYFIHEGVLYFDEVGFNLTKKFDNELEVNLPENSTPGASISVEIKSAPNSLIALMAVDEQSALINAKNDLKFEQFFSDLYHIRSRTPKIKGSGRYAGLAPGLLTLTNAQMEGFEIDNKREVFWRFFDREHDTEGRKPCIDTDAIKKSIKRALQERYQVFGNLIFENKETNDDGILNFEIKLPDKPSTWFLTVLALSNEKGFTMTKEPLKIVAKENEAEADSNKNSQNFIAQSHVVEFVVDHYENGVSKNVLNVEKPNNAEPVELTFSIMENLYGSTIADLIKYAGTMYCGGHLHMTTMIPNIVVLEYLEHFKQLDSDFALSIKKRLPEAIEREISKRREIDGSFSWFPSNPAGSPHVTSLVLQAFQRAAKFVEIDTLVIERGLNYLVSLQLESGEIAKEQKPYKYPFEPKVGVGLTSMVLLAFLQNEETLVKYKDFIKKAFEYIVSQIEPINCVYDLALAFYAMQLAKHSYAETLKQRLLEIAKINVEKNHKWWPYSLLPNEDPKTYFPISDLEVTAYVLLGLLETETIETMLPIVKWMLPFRELRNETMDCAVALNAVLKMAIKSGAALGIINLEYTAIQTQGEYSNKLVLTPENSTTIQTHLLPKHTERFEFSTKDKGTFFGKLVYRYKEGQ